MAFFMIFVGLPMYDFFHFQTLFFPEISSWLYLSSSQNARMLQYHPIRDVTVAPVDMSDCSFSVFLL